MIEFIIPTHNSPDKLKLIIGSLIVQTDNRWSAHIIIDGPTNMYDDVKDYYKTYSNIRFNHTPSKNNDWGHTPRNYGLDQAQGEWIVMTGDDNYYVPTFVEEFIKHITPHRKIIICNFIHNLVFGGYGAVNSNFQLGYIDIGSFSVRRSCIGDLRLDVNDYNADFNFVAEFNRRNLKTSEDVIKIPKYLYVHN